VSAAVDPQSLLTSAECYLCFQAEPLLKLGLLRQILLASDPMADTSPQALLSSANCYLCFGNSTSLLMAMELSLLAQIAQNGGGGGGGGRDVFRVISPLDPTSLGPVQGPAICYDDVGNFWIKDNATLDTLGWTKIISAGDAGTPPMAMPKEFTRSLRSPRPDTITVPKLEPPELVPAGAGQSVKSSRKPYWALVGILAALVWLVFSCARAHGQTPPPIVRNSLDTNAGPVLNAKHLSVTNFDLVTGTNFVSQQYGQGAIAPTTAPGALAIGTSAMSSGQNAAAIGSTAQVGLAGENPLDCANSLALGPSAQVYTNGAVSIGQQAQVYGPASVGIGKSAYIPPNSGFNAVAIGANSETDGDFGVSLGFLAYAAQKNSSAIGQHATTTDTNQIMLGIANGSVVAPGNVTVGGTLSVLNPGMIKVGPNLIGGAGARVYDIFGFANQISLAGGNGGVGYVIEPGTTIVGASGSVGIFQGPGALEVNQVNVGTKSGLTNLLARNLTASNALAVTNAISNLPTNQAPTSVTIGVTTPDAWVWFTNSGTAFAIPAWKNH
jgi:hypothetical protein